MTTSTEGYKKTFFFQLFSLKQKSRLICIECEMRFCVAISLWSGWALAVIVQQGKTFITWMIQAIHLYLSITGSSGRTHISIELQQLITYSKSVDKCERREKKKCRI